MKIVLFIAILLISATINAQTCDCKKEFLYIKDFIEKNFAGSNDKVNAISKQAYEKTCKELLNLSRGKFSSDNCILIISQYLDQFKSHHIGFLPNFTAKIDTAFVNQRPVFEISNKKLKTLRQSSSWEGIYYHTHDSSYKIAVIKDKTPLHDYVGVIIESKLPTWKKGLLKFEAKLVNDSFLYGITYNTFHRPKFDGFNLHDNNNMITGDWRREGSTKKPNPPASIIVRPPQIDSKKLSDKTFYIKISSFDPNNRATIDSILKANEDLLKTTPNLILDLRNNGGGSDFSWEPIVPYLYTSPIKTFGVDILATEANISGWKKYLENENLSAENKNELREKITKMEKDKGHWVNIENDQIDSSLTPQLYPKKIAILINKRCGSSTEEFLLVARQSSKVILLGENSIGNLDYSNVVQIPFSCFPYTLLYATTRSRRVNFHQGIDDIGIAPDYYLKVNSDWIDEALKVLEK